MINAVGEGSPVGRGELLASVQGGLATAGSVLLTGSAGIGKSTVLAAAADELAASGARVLRCRPDRTDAGIPFLTLADLLERVPDRLFDELPAAPRRALDAALLRADTPTRPPEPLAVRLGARTLLRHLAGTGPVLLAIDDVQWVDEDSAQALSWSVHRMPRSELRVLAAERTADGERTRAGALLPEGTIELAVGPLPEDAIVALLRQRVDRRLRRATAVEICRMTDGNPLYALEIAAALVRQGGPVAPDVPLPVPDALHDLLAQRLARVSGPARATLLLAAAAARPTLRLLRAAGATAALNHLAEAERCGVARLLEDGSVEFSHPLMRAVVYREGPVPRRLAAHVRLADAVADPVQRGRHLATAHSLEDENVAAALAEAAEAARRRGAPGAAAEMAELAADRTPPSDRAAWARRRLAAGRYADDAGRLDEARAMTDSVLAADGVPDRLRTEAKLNRLLHNLYQLTQLEDELAEVLAGTADDPPLAVRALLLSVNRYVLIPGGFPQAIVEARRAAGAAAAVGDVDSEFFALEHLLHLQRLTGDPGLPLTMAHAAARIAAHPLEPRAGAILNFQGRYLIAGGELARARQVLHSALSIIELTGDPNRISDVLCSLVQAEVALGHCPEALRIAARVRQMCDDLEYDGSQLAGCARAELAGGTPAEAQRLALRGLAAAQRAGDLGFVLVNHWLLGAARLHAGDAAGAVEALRQAATVSGTLGMVDLAAFPWPVDLAEALVAIGELSAAQAVLQDARPAAQRLHRQVLLAGLDRGSALVQAAQGRREYAVRQLESVVRTQQSLGVPLEQVRSLVALGVLHRRLRHRATAEKVLGTAREIAGAAGSAPWLSRIDEELGRFAGGHSRSDGQVLTPAEERIVAMIAQGSSNRQIATSMSISIKTVEGAVSRIYRKLDVRSRVELVRRTLTSDVSPP